MFQACQDVAYPATFAGAGEGEHLIPLKLHHIEHAQGEIRISNAQEPVLRVHRRERADQVQNVLVGRRHHRDLTTFG